MYGNIKSRWKSLSFQVFSVQNTWNFTDKASGCWPALQTVRQRGDSGKNISFLEAIYSISVFSLPLSPYCQFHSQSSLFLTSEEIILQKWKRSSGHHMYYGWRGGSNHKIYSTNWSINVVITDPFIPQCTVITTNICSLIFTLHVNLDEKTNATCTSV